MWVFARNLETFAEMIENVMVNLHANQLIKTLDKIVVLLTKSAINEQDKEKLFELGLDIIVYCSNIFFICYSEYWLFNSCGIS